MPTDRFGRDLRRSFNKTEQNATLQRQGHVCNGRGCKARLKQGETIFDHRIPWAQKGKTCLANCQALCLRCSAKKTNRDRIKYSNKRKPKQAEPKSIMERVATTEYYGFSG